jgi:ketosteroid isomerase-like protein
LSNYFSPRPSPWAKAVREKDYEALLAHHSDDIFMYDVPEPFQSNGIIAYKNTWDPFFSGTQQGVFDIQELHVFADENVAFGFATMKCMNRNSQGVFEPLDFRLTIGLKKLKGEWVILHEHHSVPSK